MQVIDLENVRSLSDFKRNTSEFLAKFKEGDSPLLLTINGKAELVVMDVSLFQRLVELLDRAETIDGIRKGLAEARKGKGRRAADVFEELRQRYSLHRS